MKCPYKKLNRILPLVGLKIKKSHLLTYITNIDSERLAFSVLSNQDMQQFEDELRTHVIDCKRCRIFYTNFLKNQRRGNEKLWNLDKE